MPTAFRRPLSISISVEKRWPSADDPAHMKIRVKLSHALDGLSSATTKSSLPLRNADFSTDRAHVAELTVSWQSKVFSPSEILQYAHLSTNATRNEQQYHADINKLRSDETAIYAEWIATGSTKDAPTCLFTYIDEDHFVDADDLAKGMTTAPRESMTAMANHILTHRLKGPEVARAAEPVSTSRPIITRGPRESLDLPYKEMHIMAFLRLEKPDGTSPSRHMLWTGPGANGPQAGDNLHVVKRLCTIRLYKNNLISVQPDLASKTPHKFEIQKRTFEYTIENVSEVLTPAEQEAEYRLHYEFDSKKLKTRSSMIGNEFADTVNPQNTRMSLFGEIVSALGFGNRNLFLQYLIEFPNHWSKEDIPIESLTGFTQDSRPRYDRDLKMYKATFSFPMETASLYHGTDFTDSPAPRLMVQVTSTDYWERTNTEGYGLVTIPLTAGCYDLLIPTWRPVGPLLSEIRRFFIGGGAEFEDILDQSKMTRVDGKRVNLYGLQTQSAGVTIKFNARTCERDPGRSTCYVSCAATG
ncbi:hypothetical protein SeLEV6574_g02706 [Synchytrium endobioticum]|nr:hypothetical protein SeLEV6574_g02706 [Synchytrium endobioticum]